MRNITLSFFNLALVVSALMAFSSFKATGDTKEWVANTASVKFKIKNAGFAVDGSFSELKAKLIFSADDLQNSNIEATIATKTVNTGIGSRDEHLRKETYFDVVKYPLITLKSTSFLKKADGSYEGHFKLTIKNTSKEVVIPLTYTESGTAATFKGSFTINRLNYGVGASSMILSDNVIIAISVNASKKM